MNAMYSSETAIIKMSLLVQYLRVFKAGSMRWICLSLLGIITAWGITYGFMTWVPCMAILCNVSPLQSNKLMPEKRFPGSSLLGPRQIP